MPGGGGRGPLSQCACALIPCRDECEQTAEVLQNAGVSCRHYHAGMTPLQRMKVQNDWRAGALHCIVATVSEQAGLPSSAL